MPGPPNFYLQDSSGQVWQLGSSGVGAYTTTPVSGPTGLPSVNLIDLVTEEPWTMTVLTSGALSITPALQTGLFNIPVLTPTGVLMAIVIIAGAISTIRLPVFCQTGVLYEQNRNYLPKFTQPGGPGTAAFPAQQTGELVGQWTAGCSHSFQNWMIYADSCLGVQSAFICCPVCNYIQTILTPYDLIHQYPNDIIMG
jgi:hypothetical protein